MHESALTIGHIHSPHSIILGTIWPDLLTIPIFLAIKSLSGIDGPILQRNWPTFNFTIILNWILFVGFEPLTRIIIKISWYFFIFLPLLVHMVIIVSIITTLRVLELELVSISVLVCILNRHFFVFSVLGRLSHTKTCTVTHLVMV